MGRSVLTISRDSVRNPAGDRRKAQTIIRQSLGKPGNIGSIPCQLNEEGDALLIDVPLTSTDQVYYRFSQDQMQLSNDLRLLSQPPTTTDEKGLFSLLTYGTMLPPSTIFCEVKRLLPGYKHRIELDDLTIESAVMQNWSKDGDNVGIPKLKEQVKIVGQAIDQALIESCNDRVPIILFSGGVDSGVLAARTAALGWKDTTLVNYSFGQGDSESLHAEKMAQKLGLRFVRIEAREEFSLDALARAGELYRAPFGDHSSEPTYDLTKGVIDLFSSDATIIDGTGGDGAFGLFNSAANWKKIYRTPSLIRNLAAFVYQTDKSWRQHSKVGHYLGVMRRSSFLPSLAASIAQNPLNGIAYHFDNRVINEVNEALISWISSISITQDPAELIPLTDIAVVCVNIFAQKDKSIFEEAGFQIAYPFLDNRVIDLALQRCRFWPNAANPKYLLKRLLANAVPEEMVYRPKSGFYLKVEDAMTNQLFLEELDGLLSSKLPFIDYLDQKFLHRIHEELIKGGRLSSQVYNFLWVVVLINRWLNHAHQTANQELNSEKLPNSHIPLSD